MSSLTNEQLARIEENRKKALERRAQREKIEVNRQKALQLLIAKKKEREDHVPLNAFKINSPVPQSSLCSSRDIITSDASAVNILPGKKFDETYKRSAIIAHKSSQDEDRVPLSAFKLHPSGPQKPPLSTGTRISVPSGTTASVVPRKKFKECSEQNAIVSQNSSPFSRFFKGMVSGHCQMISKDCFIAEVGFHNKMIDIFKMIKSAHYDSASKKWKFHVRDHDELMQKLRMIKDEVTFSGIPRRILNIFLKPVPGNCSLNIDISSIDPYLVSHAMPFQKEGIMFGISRRGRCLIADDMGLGKTIQALGIAHYYQSDWPLLVVCPTSVRFQWMESVHNWLPSIPPHQMTVMTSGKDFDPDAKILITSYNLVSRHVKVLNDISYGVIIVDESHFLKSRSSARSEAVCAIVKKCKRVILLSGTPALSRPVELFTQLNAIAPSIFPLFREYGIRYCAGKQSNMGFWDYNGCSNMEELNVVLQQTVMIRRLKSEVITQLPSKLRQMVLLNPGDLSKNKDVQKFEKALHNTQLKGMEKRGTLLQYYALSGKCKLPAIIDYLKDQIESGKKFIVFAHHKVVLDGICETISKQKVDFIRIDGSTSSISRKDMCDKFQMDDQCLVAVLSITAANAGITLTAAHLVIFAELFWNPGILTQAEDRAHRIGQQDCVVVQYLVAPGSADDHLWPLIQSKLEVLNKAGLSKDTFLSCATSTVNYEKTGQKNIRDFFSCLDEDDELLLQAFNEEF